MKTSSTYNKTILQYCVGTILCGVITAAVYITAHEGYITNAGLMAVFILALAFIQMIVQLFAFLHITKGTKPRWQLHSYWFAFVMILIVVVGSIWVMKNLDYNMGMSPEQMHQFMLEENKKGF